MNKCIHQKSKMNKYNLILLEGMSTSGKSRTMPLIVKLLGERGIECIGFEEAQTMSRQIFTHANPRKSIEEMKAFLDKECADGARVVVCDRFHLSHMAITNGSSSDFSEIERDVIVHKPLLVFLEIPKEKVRERLLCTTAYRGQRHEDEMKKRGNTEEETVKWYFGT